MIGCIGDEGGQSTADGHLIGTVIPGVSSDDVEEVGPGVDQVRQDNHGDDLPHQGAQLADCERADDEKRAEQGE